MTSQEMMTTYEVAEYLGYTNTKGVSAWARRHGIVPLHRQAGKHGVNMYARHEVIEGKNRMPGQGVRSKKSL